MKLPLKIGCPNHEPYLYVGQDNTIEGVYAPLVYARHYFLHQIFNVTLVDLGPRETEFCDEKGNCTGSLRFLQTGAVDYANLITQNQLSSIPVNLNIGPIIRQSECYLINKPKTQIDLKSEDFLSIIYKLDVWVLMLSFVLLFVFIVLTLVNKYLVNYQVNERALTLWNLYEIAFGRGRIRVNLGSNLFIGFSFSWFIFFLNLISSTSFKTDLIRSRKFLHIDTLKDVLDHELTPIALGVLFCRYSIQNPCTPEYQKIASRLRLIQPEEATTSKLIDVIYDNHQVLVEDATVGLRLKGMTCMLDGPVDENSSPLYISKTSVGQLLYQFVVSLSTDPKVARSAKEAAYRVFETANFDNKVIQRIDLSTTRADIYSQCMQTKVADEKTISAPLSMENLFWMFKVLSVIETFAIMVFLLESVFKHNKNSEKN